MITGIGIPSSHNKMPRPNPIIRSFPSPGASRLSALATPNAMHLRRPVYASRHGRFQALEAPLLTARVAGKLDLANGAVGQEKGPDAHASGPRLQP